MTSALLHEHELMLNVGLGAEAIRSYVTAFCDYSPKTEASVTLWHITTVLPLVFNERSRLAISKRQVTSGMRSMLTRDPANGIAQNEAIFGLDDRLRALYPRTARSLNCALAWGLVQIQDGAITPGDLRANPRIVGEAKEIVRAASKLGTWAAQLSAFEYFAVLGVEFPR